MGIAREIAQEIAPTFEYAIANNGYGERYHHKAVQMLHNVNSFADILKAFQTWHNDMASAQAYQNMLSEDCPLFQRFFGGYDSIKRATKWAVDQGVYGANTQDVGHKTYFEWLDTMAAEIDSKLGGGDMIGALSI